ncbi:acyl-ACP desaturase [Nocardia sp. NPDC004068]|uniref:acyl-ACP desaturase n=1 Tax=Nocardia sp. NPDC004068 TaxID=3364303 RepID=UPI0036798A3E
MTETIPPALPPLDLTSVRGVVEPAVRLQADRDWRIDDLNWSAIRPELLTDTDTSVVRFITFVEDHIPGYLTWLLREFPVDNAADPIPSVAINREYFRFFVAWAHDEERHAAVLTRYQEEADINTPERLRLELAEEGRKHFGLPYSEPLEAFVYTMIQEKATQLFYQRFRAVAREPVLRDLLNRLGRDEARHFAFYTRLVEEYLRRDARAAAPHLREVVRGFRMPLSETLGRYRRWSLEVADATHYDHTEAFLALVRVIDRFTDGPAGTGLDDVGELVAALRTLA